MSNNNGLRTIYDMTITLTREEKDTILNALDERESLYAAREASRLEGYDGDTAKAAGELARRLREVWKAVPSTNLKA